MTKEERSKIAIEHVSQMAHKYETKISDSVKNSRIYRGANVKGIKSKPIIYVEDSTAEDAVFKYAKIYDDSLCLLNFASYKHPGGGFIKGSIAQEEAICHASTLYNILSDEKFEEEYEYNNKHLNENLYEDFAIFTPDVAFEDEQNRAYYANVLTVPAPNKKAYNGKSIEKYERVLAERIDYILNIMKCEHQSTLILGAFGCGVFGNNPYMVASIFKRLIESKYLNDFKEIIFAIPNKDGYNFNEFEKVFSHWNDE